MRPSLQTPLPGKPAPADLFGTAGSGIDVRVVIRRMFEHEGAHGKEQANRANPQSTAPQAHPAALAVATTFARTTPRPERPGMGVGEGRQAGDLWKPAILGAARGNDAARGASPGRLERLENGRLGRGA